MNPSKTVVARHDTTRGSVRSYVVGFLASLILTLTAYLAVSHDVFRGWTLVYTLGALAAMQLLVQLVFFLHLGRESRPRWNLTVMLFAVMVVATVVFGSLWIMQNLAYGHHHDQLTPQQTNRFIINDEGYQR